MNTLYNTSSNIEKFSGKEKHFSGKPENFEPTIFSGETRKISGNIFW